ncbi:MAG TPA: hypothetical protein VMC83_32795, partial [Streptosporangiaceae bacterium]|nr:hypothetical protein [Streptosporangiaceae bacterium]
DTVTPASDLAATIDWGDGTQSAGTVSGSAGSFAVSGTHTYTTAGQDTVTVTLSDDAPGTATAQATSTVTVSGGTLAATEVLTTATEHVALPGTTTIATFTDTDTVETAAGFTASINWGDGTITTGTVTGSNGSFAVSGGHTYADEGSDPLSVTVTRTVDNATASASGTVTVGENDMLTGLGTTLAATTNQALNNVTVATFTDTDTVTPASDLTATINWGDGNVTAGTVTGSAGSFAVSGSHTYTAAGQDTVTVTLSDDAPGTATAQATTTVNVSAPQGQTFVLTTSPDNVQGGAGDDTVDAASGTLSAGDHIDGGGGTNTLALIGAGTFNLKLPTTLSNIQIITAQEGQAAYSSGGQTFAAQNQIVTLRDGMDATVNVSDAVINPSNPKPATITIIGAHNAAVINLGSGNDVVTVGDAAETVHGGGGNDTILVTKDTIGATISGGTGQTALDVSGGGTMAMGSNITEIASVLLGASTTAYNFTANGIGGLLVNDASTGSDTIAAGGTGQTLTGGGAGKLTMVGFSGGGTTFMDKAALFSGDQIQNFAAPNDVIDLTDVNFATLHTPQFVEDASNTFGILTVTDGTHTASIKLFGQFAAAGFQSAPDTGTGTQITYQPPLQQQLHLATPHV